MNKTRLENTSGELFHTAWKTYEEAFPLEERRLLTAQTSLMKQSAYHFDTWLNEDQFVGLILWWDFETLRYVDHFATSVEQRNNGFGKLILEEFMHSSEKSIILEVELPDSKINKRRIKFYERMGFKLNDYHYVSPPMAEGKQSLHLLLMSYPDLLSAKEVDDFKTNCHPIIFKE